ncbi:photosystem II stability/assembly factor-like uncharacterized protein [Methylohalomonas lacus]|uniref:Photosystem II stability/assembly factor-like uncharacterized protein n=1 Tax=Methylohalomonas lacus TaxID=398773 RepID=A0AAE3HHC9_9GAMM|nr:YCF48-related protein [Methylohalomonas lacus]MCS3902340.1 photosystem II stability/assembly factor-like uncharacterized protein [Methylohalomonas lacus]
MRCPGTIFLLFTLVCLPGAGVHADSAWPAPLADESLLLDLVRTDEGFHAVGARGHVLFSTDGNDWQQRIVPTRVLLTAVDFHDNKRGCAVGHDAVILCTDDGGEHWQRAHAQPDWQAPLLDVLFINEREVIAIGAHGLYLVSQDAGRSWQRRPFTPAADASDATDYEPHLHTVLQHDGRLLIAAEAGQLFASSNAGADWQQLSSPYTGSWFALVAGAADTFYLAGLRGHLYAGQLRSPRQWRRLPADTRQTLTDGRVLAGGEQVFVGHGGVVLYRATASAAVHVWRYPGRPALQAVVRGPGETLLLASDAGLLSVDLAELRALEP